eukprot:9175598-Pyramimonas_sp.AAC.1
MSTRGKIEGQLLCTLAWHVSKSRRLAPPIEDFLKAAVVAEGGVRLHGPAPRGPLERVQAPGGPQLAAD